jgi:sortase A
MLLVPFFYIGEKIGTIKFPSINHSVDAIQGDEEPQLRLGAGHSLYSYMPGQDNNSVFGAHRTTYFKKLENIKVGDSVNFEAVYGYFKYKIDEIRIINGGDNSVAKETSKEQLTLYTCYPFIYFGNAPKRFVLICSLVESEIYK